MIKVYLDWNCITNDCKGFLTLAEKYKDHVLFPYTREHVRDLSVSKKHKDYFYADLHILKQICGDNLLNINDDQSSFQKFCPLEYQRKNGWRLRIIQIPFNWISRNNYNRLKHSVQKNFSKAELDYIRNKDAQDVIKYLDDYVMAHHLGNSLEDFSNRWVPRYNWLYNTQSRLKGVYFALDMIGYYSDKKSKKHFSFTNLDIDANHVTNGIFCDCFVTDDTRQRIKAEAIYKRYGSQSEIVIPEELEEWIKTRLSIL